MEKRLACSTGQEATRPIERVVAGTASNWLMTREGLDYGDLIVLESLRRYRYQSQTFLRVKFLQATFDGQKSLGGILKG